MTKKHNLGFIVKVQLALFEGDTSKSMLVYDEHREHVYEGDVDLVTRHIMDSVNTKKMFFWAHMEGDRLVLDNRAEDQTW